MSAKTRFEILTPEATCQVDGGVAPIYLPNGDVITCTDPRRWGGLGWPLPNPLTKFPRL